MKPIGAVLAAVTLLASAPLAALDYPPTPRGEVIDDYFGTRVADPYRWLEDTDAPATRAWVEAQNRLSLPFLAALPEREPIRRRLTELWNFERVELVHKVAGHYFYARNDGLQNQSVLHVQPAAGGAARVLLDPNRLSADGTVALTQYEVSPDGAWIAYGIASAGSDWNEFRVRRVADGVDGPDRLTRIKFSTIAWSGDARGFFYARYPEPPKDAQPGVFDDLAHQKLYYHRLGTPQSEDVLIHEEPAQPKWGFRPWVSEDGRWLAISVWRASGDDNALYVKELGRGAPRLDAPLRRLVSDFDARYQVIGSRGSELYVFTNAAAPRGRLVSTDLAQPGAVRWRTRVGETADTLQHALIAGGELLALYTHDAASRLRRHALDGQRRGEIPLPGLGSIPDLSVGGIQISGSANDAELFYGYTSFTQPLQMHAYDLRRNHDRVFAPLKLGFEPAQYQTTQLFCSSRDGTRVPVFVSHRKGLPKNGDQRAFLHAYGGFNVAKTPQFDVSALVWMERGGVYAVANLRGGGEYGRDWHQAGTKERKQNVFDDFVAAGGCLAREGYTRAERLGIWGRSNGGLLVGATINQHPQLFAAAAATVGVMDMLRYHRFTIGWAWASDYGTSESAEGFRYLHAYSPYHNVRRGTRYPATLIMTGDHDDRVVPGHSYKYAAALQQAQAGQEPVLIRIDVKTGHGGGKPIGKLIEEEADKLAFLWHYTDGE